MPGKRPDPKRNPEAFIRWYYVDSPAIARFLIGKYREGKALERLEREARTGQLELTI